MASQQERGGHAYSDEADPMAMLSSTTPSSTSPRHVPYPPPPSYCDVNSANSSTIHSLTSASTIDSKLDLSPSDSAARKGLLRDSFFDSWREDGDIAVGSTEEMQRKDPLATQIWKLYSKTKTQLPNAERMENLTWRMMSMNLRRKERERLRQQESVSSFLVVCC